MSNPKGINQHFLWVVKSTLRWFSGWLNQFLGMLFCFESLKTNFSKFIFYYKVFFAILPTEWKGIHFFFWNANYFLIHNLTFDNPKRKERKEKKSIQFNLRTEISLPITKREQTKRKRPRKLGIVSSILPFSKGKVLLYWHMVCWAYQTSIHVRQSFVMCKHQLLFFLNKSC